MSSEYNTIDFLSRDIGFVVVHQNIRSMRANFDAFLVEIATLENIPKIIIFSEIWIKESEIELYQIPNYNFHIKTNETHRAGGVAVYFHNTINNVKSLTVHFISADVIEIVFKELGHSFNLLAVYKLHDYSNTLFMEELKTYLSRSSLKSCRNLLIVGDMNLNLLQNNYVTDEYKYLIANNGLQALINSPTRITEQSESCIDHVLAKISNLNEVLIDATIIESNITDHYMTAVWLRDGRGVTADNAAVKVESLAYRTDYNKLDILLNNIDWSNVYLQINASHAFDSFYAIIHNLVLECKVEFKLKKQKIVRLKPWIDIDTCKRIKTRNALLKKVKSQPNNTVLSEYLKSFRNKLNSDIRVLKDNYYSQLFENSKNDPKRTWEILKEVTGQKTTNSNADVELEVDGVILSDPCKITNEFNNYFLSVGDKLSSCNNKKDNFNSLNLKNKFTDFSIAQSIFIEPVLEHELIRVIESLKNGKSPGIDGISSTLIKKSYKSFLPVILYIINFSFQSGIFPDKLKEALVIPIHKKNKKTDCNNYRPISLLSSFSKIFEKLMKERLVKFLDKIHFFSKNQFGFRQGLNTEMALLEFMDRVSGGINDGKRVSGLFLDITKAFDTVNHSILLKKLFSCGIRGVVYDWFQSYLSKRRQCVRVNGMLSQFGEIKHGVPQGSVLGATLFLIYINDLCKGNFNGQVVSFADDTALSYVGDSLDEITLKMNSDLEALRWWFTDNNLVLSVSKTNYINFSLREKLMFSDRIVYKCSNCLCSGGICKDYCAEIEQKDHIRYLGVILDSELNWKTHISSIKKKLINILRLLYFLRRMCKNYLMRTLYFSLVHSRINYGIECWGGTYISNLKSLITIQKHFVRIVIKGKKYDSSWPIFKSLKILPIRNMYVYKVMKLFFNRSRNSYAHNVYKIKLRNPDNVAVPRPTKTFFTKTYNFLAPMIFNRLPNNIKNVDASQTFAGKLRDWLITVQDINSLLFEIQS